MNKCYSLLLFVLFTLVSLQTYAQPDDKESMLDTLMERSGLNAQISQFPAQIEMGMGQASGGNDLTADELANLNRLTRQVFTAESLQNDIRQHLNDHMETGTVAQALAWLDSPLGRKITALETAASTPEAITEMQQLRGFYAAMNPLGPRRNDVIPH